MPKRSAGLILFRRKESLEVFLVHPGGPLWATRDLGAWSIPKGEYKKRDEDPLAAAQREFQEETGFTAHPPFLSLGEVTQAGGKIVTAWATRGDCDPAKLVSNTFLLEWPPHSGNEIEVPEVDRGAWFTIRAARTRLKPAQHPFLDRLVKIIGG